MSKQYVQESCFITTKVAICPPPPGLCYILAWADTETETGHSINPAVGLQTVVKREYYKSVPRDSCPEPCVSHAAFIEKGWTYAGERTTQTVLFVSDEFSEIVSSDFELLKNPNSVGEVFFSTDPAAVATKVAQLTSQAVKKYKEWRLKLREVQVSPADGHEIPLPRIHGEVPTE